MNLSTILLDGNFLNKKKDPLRGLIIHSIIPVIQFLNLIPRVNLYLAGISPHFYPKGFAFTRGQLASRALPDDFTLIVFHYQGRSGGLGAFIDYGDSKES